MRNKSQIDEIKRKLRQLKQAEVKIRFGGVLKPGAALIWDGFFDLRDGVEKGGYSLAALAAMDKNAYKRVVDEFFSYVYYEYYKENGITNIRAYDPDVLSSLDLPFDAAEGDIKRRFRELAKEYHPDTGGDAAKFIALMEAYKKLIAH